MRITKFHFQVLRTQDVKGDVRSLEGDGTLLRPLLKITSGKNLLSDCLGVDYSIILLLLLLFTVGIYVCHIIIYAYYLPVCRHSCLPRPWLCYTDKSTSTVTCCFPFCGPQRTVRAMVCVAKSMIEAISPEFVPSRSSFLSFSTAMLSSEVILDGHFFVRLLAEAESSVEASLLTCREAMTLAHEPMSSNTATRNLMRFMVHK